MNNEQINPAFWLEVIRTNAYVTDCSEKSRSLVNAAEKLGQYIAALAPPSGEVVEARQARYEREIATATSHWIDSFQERFEDGDDVPDKEHFVALWLAERQPPTPQSAPVDGDADQPAGGWDAVDADNGFRRYPWTYQNQPGNVGASVLGGACNQASAASAGDTIDRGLGLLKALHERGFGIVRVPKIAVQAPTPPPASQERGSIPWGSWDTSGRWFPNTSIAMSADEQYRQNVENGYIKPATSPPSSAAENQRAARSSASSSPAGSDDAVEGSTPSASHPIDAAEQAKPDTWSKLVQFSECTRDCDCVGECKAGLEQAKPDEYPPDFVDALRYDVAVRDSAEQAQAGELEGNLDCWLDDLSNVYQLKSGSDIKDADYKRLIRVLHQLDAIRSRLADGVTVDDAMVETIGAALYVYWSDVNEQAKRAYRKKVRAALVEALGAK